MKFDWIRIPSGKFIMGITNDEAAHLAQSYHTNHFLLEAPRREVYLDSFEISQYPVTNEQFKEFVETTSHSPPISPYFAQFTSGQNEELAHHPVAWISWNEAMAFCQWANCRLPTAAEWEKAARGPQGFRYPWGNKWQDNLCNSIETETRMTTPVGLYPQGASPYGVLDLAGNVWEWTDDWITTNTLSTKVTARVNLATAEETVEDDLEQFVHFPILRGGSTIASRIGVRCTFKFVKYNLGEPGDWVGFRCVRLK